MARTTDISARELAESVVDDTMWWLDSEQVEGWIRKSCADPSLLQELDELLPDTLAEL
jgi:hypothetical protein